MSASRTTEPSNTTSLKDTRNTPADLRDGATMVALHSNSHGDWTGAAVLADADGGGTTALPRAASVLGTPVSLVGVAVAEDVEAEAAVALESSGNRSPNESTIEARDEELEPESVLP